MKQVLKSGTVGQMGSVDCSWDGAKGKWGVWMFHYIFMMLIKSVISATVCKSRFIR